MQVIADISSGADQMDTSSDDSSYASPVVDSDELVMLEEENEIRQANKKFGSI